MTSDLSPVVQKPCVLSTTDISNPISVSYDALPVSRQLTDAEIIKLKIPCEDNNQTITNSTKREGSISHLFNTPSQIVFWLAAIAIVSTFTLSLASMFSNKSSSREVTKDFIVHIAVPLVSLPAAFFSGLYVGKTKNTKD